METKRLVTDAETIAQMEAEQEMERAVADLVTSAREFFEIRPECATDYERPGIVWWRRLEALALADSRTKEAFSSQPSPAVIHRMSILAIGGEFFPVVPLLDASDVICWLSHHRSSAYIPGVRWAANPTAFARRGFYPIPLLFAMDSILYVGGVLPGNIRNGARYSSPISSFHTEGFARM